ncbi:MAG: MFS transporter [Gammaproteobacteria bacterium]|nr:MFS transporter [Gammaproteobacteria bacterium]
MSIPNKPSFFTLLIMISFASVNAVLFTPALPDIAKYFLISSDVAQQTIIWYLVGYTIGQLFYGPIANRFGRKPALYIGISLQILSSILCVGSGYLHSYSLLVIGRFLLALGSGVGLQIAFTLVNEFYEPQVASQKISYLIMAFAITPGLSIALGGILTEYFNWISCFDASAVYGIILLLLVTQLPESSICLDNNALKLKNLFRDYFFQFKNIQLVSGGLIMGGSSCFNYVFSAFAPFIAIKLSGMSSSEYGFLSLLPPIGLLIGSIVSAQLAKVYDLKFLIKLGLAICTISVIIMLLAMLNHVRIIFSLFIPMTMIFFGLCFILANASTIAMSQVRNKSHGSSVLNFLNIGLATLVVFSLTYLPIKMLLMPSVFIIFILGMVFLYKILTKGFPGN